MGTDKSTHLIIPLLALAMVEAKSSFALSREESSRYDLVHYDVRIQIDVSRVAEALISTREGRGGRERERERESLFIILEHSP